MPEGIDLFRCFCLMCSPNGETGICLNCGLPCPGCGHSYVNHIGYVLRCTSPGCNCPSFGHLDDRIFEQMDLSGCSVTVDSFRPGDNSPCCTWSRLKHWYGDFPIEGPYRFAITYPNARWCFINRPKEHIVIPSDFVVKHKELMRNIVVTMKCMKCGDLDPFNHRCGSKERIKNDGKVKKIVVNREEDDEREIPF